tara:strand:+ start:17 stop:1144 length:1128 start_codon:yes stop_codon:yes gene_type:complete
MDKKPLPKLFSSISLGNILIENRVVVSPMCQYAADNGSMNEWHMAHLSSLSLSGAGLLFFEATSVSQEGRITHGCAGLYSEKNYLAIKRVIEIIRKISPVKIGIQIAHAGRKASSNRPWDGGKLINIEDGGWQTYAPSSIAQIPGENPPIAMSLNDIEKLKNSYKSMIKKSKKLGFDVVELHLAHGYLLHQFLSPLSNKRNDIYGGSLQNRMRLILEIFEIVREEAGSYMAVGARLSATDWTKDGWDITQSIELAKKLELHGADFLDISSGGLAFDQKINLKPGYQVPFAKEIKKNINIPVIAVGLITKPKQAEEILNNNDADLIAMARSFISNPRWPWQAAAELGATINGYPQYFRCLPSNFPRIFGNTITSQR